MTMSKIRWSEAPIIYLPIPTCPGCGTIRKPDIKHVDRAGDGSFSRQCVCRECGARFVLVFELPESGEVHSQAPMIVMKGMEHGT